MGKCTEGIECKEPVEYTRNIYVNDRIAGIARESTLVYSPGIVRVRMIWVGTGRQSGSCRPAGRGKGEVLVYIFSGKHIVANNRNRDRNLRTATVPANGSRNRNRDGRPKRLFEARRGEARRGEARRVLVASREGTRGNPRSRKP